MIITAENHNGKKAILIRVSLTGDPSPYPDNAAGPALTSRSMQPERLQPNDSGFNDDDEWIHSVHLDPDYIDPMAIEVVAMLGAGSYSGIFAENPIVIKYWRMETEAARHQALDEWRRWRRWRHPHIIAPVGVTILLDGGNESNLALVFPAWPTLRDFFRARHLSDVVIMQLAAEIASALKYLHSQRFVHGDITPDSIVVHPKMKAQLTIFGEHDESGFGSRRKMNALDYAAPEIVHGELRGPFGYNCRVDIWSIGVILCEMLFGKLIWPIMKDSDSIPRPSLPPATSPALKELVDSCLEMQCHQRPSAEKLEKRLRALVVWKRGQTENGNLVRRQVKGKRRLYNMNGRHQAPGCVSNRDLVDLYQHFSNCAGKLASSQVLLLEKFLAILECKTDKNRVEGLLKGIGCKDDSGFKKSLVEGENHDLIHISAQSNTLLKYLLWMCSTVLVCFITMMFRDIVHRLQTDKTRSD